MEHLIDFLYTFYKDVSLLAFLLSLIYVGREVYIFKKCIDEDINYTETHFNDGKKKLYLLLAVSFVIFYILK